MNFKPFDLNDENSMNIICKDSFHLGNVDFLEKRQNKLFSE